jgi:hypothetical protein
MDTNVHFEALLSLNMDIHPSPNQALGWLSSHGINVDYVGTYSISCHCSMATYDDIFGRSSEVPDGLREHVVMIEIQSEVDYL